MGDATSAGPREFRLAQEAGFATAVTTRPGVLFPEHHDCLTALPRITLNGRIAYRDIEELAPEAFNDATTLDKILARLGRSDNPLFELALRLEEIALKDEYFVSRKLYPNVDFYSGVIYSAIGIPRSMFTVMFAIARTVGWVAHWLEMIGDPEMRIVRPRQLYTGPTQRKYVDLAKRK